VRGVNDLLKANFDLSDGFTRRKMREHSCNTFDEIYIVNLHGNSRINESGQNIFDVMVG
jgi:predicted helicase